MALIQRLLAWAQRNERHLGAVLFVSGFITDLFTFALLPVAFVNLAFLGYLALATIATLGSHLFSSAREHPSIWRRALSVIFPLVAQYAIGSLLSGCLIFYTKSSALFVSWPFLLLLVLVFIGNEYFRTYYKHLAFQMVLLFFAIYAYAIFAVPLVAHKLGWIIFLISTGASIVLFAGVLYFLSRIHRPGFIGSLRYTIPGVATIVILMCGSYFLGLIPPIPLTLPSAGIYHSVTKIPGGYKVTTEAAKPWWDPREEVVHHVPGTPLYAFTSISAPTSFGASIVHVWEWYDSTGKRWVQRNRFAFPISGGRDGGYRGYSEVTDPEAGKWRISIETPDRQVVGRITFIVETVLTPPLLTEEQK